MKFPQGNTLLVHLLLFALQIVFFSWSRTAGNHQQGGAVGGRVQCPACPDVDVKCPEAIVDRECPKCPKCPRHIRNQQQQEDGGKHDEPLAGGNENEVTTEQQGASSRRRRTATLQGLPIQVSDNFTAGGDITAAKPHLSLTVPHSLVELNPQTGKIIVPAGIDRLCVDVGAHWSAPSARAWWNHHPATYVVAIEANPYSAGWLRTFATKHFFRNAFGHIPDESHKKPEGNQPQCTAKVIRRCLEKGWGHWIENEEKHTIINAAMVDGTVTSMTTTSSSSEGAAGGGEKSSTAGTMGYFNPGVGNRSDVGSIFQLSSKYQKSLRLKKEDLFKPAVVPLLSLAELFTFLPSTTAAAEEEGGEGDENQRGGGNELVWDTLKIDAQGADLLVLLGADTQDKILSKFMCVIGEFDTDAYDVKSSTYSKGKGYGQKWLHKDMYQKLLSNHGFAMVDRRFYVNPRFQKVFEEGPSNYNCRAADEKRTHQAIMSALKNGRNFYGKKSSK